MAKKFSDTQGGATRTKMDQYEYVMNDNHIRLVGDLLPRYVYWIKGDNDKAIPFECLAFDREEEEFIREEKDWVPDYPKLSEGKNCTWAYSVQCFDPNKPEKLMVLNLKKKLFDQIMVAAEDLGDPTDIEDGWDILFTKKKTGSKKYNVEYTLQVLKCSSHKRPLTEEERELIKDIKSMEEHYPRPTPEAQKELLEKFMKRFTPDQSESIEEDISSEFKDSPAADDFDDDTPF